MTFNFSMQAIDQIINSAAKALYMSGADGLSDCVSRAERGCQPGGGPAFAMLCQLVRTLSGPEGYLPGLLLMPKAC